MQNYFISILTTVTNSRQTGRLMNVEYKISPSTSLLYIFRIFFSFMYQTHNIMRIYLGTQQEAYSNKKQ